MSINALKNHAKTFLIISLIFLLSPSLKAFGESPENKGYEIAARSDRSDNGYGDSKVEMTMILRNAAGDETTRSISFTTLERENEDVGDLIDEDPLTTEELALKEDEIVEEP